MNNIKNDNENENEFEIEYFQNLNNVILYKSIFIWIVLFVILTLIYLIYFYFKGKTVKISDITPDINKYLRSITPSFPPPLLDR